MKFLKRLSIIILLFAISVNAQKILEQELSGYNNPEELVTLSQNIPFNQAVNVLSKISEKTTGKNIVSTINIDSPIGIEIDKMHFLKALVIIVQFNNMVFEEKADVIVIKGKNETNIEELSEDIYAPISEREVKISAIFFEADVSEMRERGVNWQFLLSQNGFSIGSALQTTSNATASAGEGQQTPLDYNVSTKSEFEFGNFTGDATALFRFFENENLGEIISKPSITVRSGQLGRIQIGSDVSIKQKDFAGNIIDVFISTGTIIEVTPRVYTEEGVDYVLLNLNVERSSGLPGELSTVITKTNAKTNILMHDGEETAIGGLFVNEEKEQRIGIPILKDLPWWVLGIRYLTGYDKTEVTKKEVVILVKSEIVPTIKERISNKKENLLKQFKQENLDVLKKYSKSFNKQKKDSSNTNEGDEVE